MQTAFLGTQSGLHRRREKIELRFVPIAAAAAVWHRRATQGEP